MAATFGKKSTLSVTKSSSIEDTGSDKMTEEACRNFLLGLTSFSGSLGLIIFITGCVVTANYNLLLDFITGRYPESSVFMIIIGITTVAVSALGKRYNTLMALFSFNLSAGFYASLRFHYTMMMTFLAVMILSIICEVVGSITMFALNQDPSQQMILRERMQDSLKEYDRHNITWDMVQTDLQCCGVINHQDYPSQFTSLPISCCGPLKLDSMNQAEDCKPDTASLHTRGCYEALEEYLKSKMGVLGGIAAGAAVLQISTISAAAVLVSKWSRPASCYPCY